MKGADYAWSHPGITALKAAGIRFACRYLSRDTSKNLTATEAGNLTDAGIAVVVVWESGAQDMLRGYAGGVSDAQSADLQARACGLPGIPVYFAADWDAAEGQQAAINAYLDGAAQVIGKTRVGMYGGFFPVSRARAAGKVSYTWGTVAWSGSNWATCGWKPSIMQGATVTIGGASCDLDTANFGDFGQYQGGTVDSPILSVGDTGPAVATMQRRLVLWGAALTCDGDFGAVTLAALIAFQRARGLAPDGVCGPDTWTQLGKAPPGDSAWHGEYVTGGMFPLDDLAAKLGWPVNTLLRMTAVHYGTFGDDLGAWLAAVLTGGRHDVPVPAGVKLWAD